MVRLSVNEKPRNEECQARQRPLHPGRKQFRRSDSCTGQLNCDGKREEIRFRLFAKRTSPFKSAGASVQSITGSRGVSISGSNAGYTMF